MFLLNIENFVILLSMYVLIGCVYARAYEVANEGQPPVIFGWPYFAATGVA